MLYHKISTTLLTTLTLPLLSFSTYAKEEIDSNVPLPDYINLSVSKIENRHTTATEDTSAPSTVYKADFYENDEFKELYDAVTTVKAKVEHPVEINDVPVSDDVKLDIKPTFLTNRGSNSSVPSKFIGIQFEARLF
jgi:hypothetical protein